MNADTAAILSAIATVASCIATIVLAALTAKYVRLTRELVEEARNAKQPTLFVDVEFDSAEMKFVVGNSGSAAALDIVFQIKDPIPWRTPVGIPSGLNAVSAVKNGIRYLAPGRALKYSAGFLPQDTSMFADGDVIEIDVAYGSDNGRRHNRNIAIDLKSYENVLLESFLDPQREVAKAIRDSSSARSTNSVSSQIVARYTKRNCPSCGEQISRSAKKCPHCHESIAVENSDSRTE